MALNGIRGQLLLDPATISDPTDFYRLLHARAPVWRVPETNVFIVSTYDLIVEATGRTADFSSNLLHLLYRDETGLPRQLSFGSGGEQTLANADPPAHAIHKRIVFPEFVAKRMAQLEPEIAEVSRECIDAAVSKGRADFMDEVGDMVPITIISQLIGFRDSRLKDLLQAAFDSTDLISATLSLADLQSYVARSNDISTWIGEQLATAGREPGEDILTSLAHSVGGGDLSIRAAITILHTLLSAGGESTTSLLGNAVRVLAERPDIQQRLREAPDAIPGFVEEVLRLESPFRFHHRSAPHATKLGGVEIPAGANVLLFWGAANRDPNEYERPDELVLDRPARHAAARHLAFGRGIHQCVGAPLARMEARIVLTILLDRTRSFAISQGQTPRWVNSLAVRRHAELPLELVGG
jgi:cytochrome P450